jgi:hypothetical protein
MNGWDAHVWQGDHWVGQFSDAETARKWIADREGYTLTDYGPAELKARLAEPPKV